MHILKRISKAAAAAVLASAAIGGAAAADNAPQGQAFISYDDQAQARRQAYQQAKQLAQSGDVSGVASYTSGVLRDYPLNTYLRYYLLQSNVSDANYKAALQFVKHSGDRELSLLLADTYSAMLAREGRYRQMRELIGRSPYGSQVASDLNVKQTARQCRWYEAELGSGRGDSRAVAFASELYARQKPYPDGCAGLIAQWAARGYLTAAASGRRFESIYLSRRGSQSLASAAASALPSSSYAQSAQLALSAFDDPSGYAGLQDRGAAVLAFRRYAVFNPIDASAEFDSFNASFNPNGTERLEILKTIAQGRLGFQSSEEDVKWV
ncbi:MAG: hypothetical protein ACI4NA_04555, partial [Succinivibrio sp.]